MEGMEEFHKKYYKYLLNYFKSRVGYNNPDAEDLASEVIIKAWMSLPTFEGKSTEPHWVFCIATNRYRDYLRRKKKITFTSLDAGAPSNDYSDWGDEDFRFMDTAAGPAEILERKEKIEATAKAIESLRPNHKIVIELFYYDGKEVEEIAKELGIPVGTVKSRLFRARVNIGKKLKHLIEA